jgi:hypothetical protein
VKTGWSNLAESSKEGYSSKFCFANDDDDDDDKEEEVLSLLSKLFFDSDDLDIIEDDGEECDDCVEECLGCKYLECE